MLRELEDACVIALTGEVDMETVPLLMQAVHAAQAACSQIIIDVTQLTFLDIPPLHALLTPLYQGTPVWVAGPLADEVERLLTVTGAVRDLHFYPDVTAALTAAQAGLPVNDGEGSGTSGR
ncbi:STAS domain-containing protein [Streptomyces parvus]|uniref:STAS domain-containing protein n=1 Tax=Streptomyces parvus TaxID=66428 RepID=A0A5D4JC99_9ACTN|nr:STAS domain-containing protein [Streptomyces parvus]TYR63187.1 STAS domain-containing protein [Streptomyces parvus]